MEIIRLEYYSMVVMYEIIHMAHVGCTTYSTYTIIVCACEHGMASQLCIYMSGCAYVLSIKNV